MNTIEEYAKADPFLKEYRNTHEYCETAELAKEIEKLKFKVLVLENVVFDDWGYEA